MSNIVKFYDNLPGGLNGLANIANTCYINTCVQCLGFCGEFLSFVLDENNNECKEVKEGDLLYELREIYKALWIKDTGLIPARFLKILEKHLDFLRLGEQNDIQEFLTIFIDQLNGSIAKDITIKRQHVDNKEIYFENPSLEKLKKKCDVAWKNSVGKEYSPLIDMFYGQLIVQIICGNCDKIHHTIEPFSVLLLPIVKNDSEDSELDLETCLAHLFKDEILNADENNVWKCDGCQQCCKSIKTTKIWRYPRILTVCMKRFTYDGKKNNKHVKLSNIMDISKFGIYTAENNKATYQLSSIACHVGNQNRGHYYALCKHVKNKRWYKIDDTRLVKMGEECDMTHDFYMGFYTIV
jgi:ubiquitin C-terminal hydrolase